MKKSLICGTPDFGTSNVTDLQQNNDPNIPNLSDFGKNFFMSDFQPLPFDTLSAMNDFISESNDSVAIFSGVNFNEDWENLAGDNFPDNLDYSIRPPAAPRTGYESYRMIFMI